MQGYQNYSRTLEERQHKESKGNICLQKGSFLAGLADLLHQEGGSDIIVNAHAKPAVKVHGKVRHCGDKELTADETIQLAKSLMSKRRWSVFEETYEMNFMVDYPGVAYFRTNVFRQRGEVGLVLRLIPLEVPPLETLNLPDVLGKFAMLKRGLVLFSGAAGVGKSTSLAAMLDYRNKQIADHIITIEDPIEFIHRNKKSILTQREIDIDTHSYAVAMKSALRQAPDVMLVGEIRDREVMSQVLSFAETGHLVFATIHATTTALTLDRIINLFPSEQHEQLKLDLSQNLRAIVTQRLIKKTGSKDRIPALEVMSNTPHIAQLIRESRLSDIPESMRRSTLKEGVITIDNYIFELYEAGKINYEECLLYVDSPNNFRVRLRSESKHPLPDELKTQDQHSWKLEKSAADEKKRGTFGNFSANS